MSVEGLGGQVLRGAPIRLVFFAAEERDVLRQFSAGRFTIFNIIDWPFHYRSLAYLIHAMPVKGVGVREFRGVPFT